MHDSHPFHAWRLEGTLRHFSHHHPSRFDSSLFISRRPYGLSRPVQATLQSSAASCPGVEVVVVRQFDERLWERLCIEGCTVDVNGCHNVILVPSSRRGVTEYTVHQFQFRSWRVVLRGGAVHPFELLCNPSSLNVGFSGVPLFGDDPSGPDHFASNLEYLFDVFLLFSFGLIDQSYRNASFLGVVSHHLLAFFVKTVFHHPVDVLAVEPFMALCKCLRMLVNVRDD